MLTWIAGNDLLSTEDNLVSFKLSLIIRDQRDVWTSTSGIRTLTNKGTRYECIEYIEV